jgi:hypothetical protein
MSDATGEGETNSSICGFAFLSILATGRIAWIDSSLHVFFLEVDSSC